MLMLLRLCVQKPLIIELNYNYIIIEILCFSKIKISKTNSTNNIVLPARNVKNLDVWAPLLLLNTSIL